MVKQKMPKGRYEDKDSREGQHMRQGSMQGGQAKGDSSPRWIRWVCDRVIWTQSCGEYITPQTHTSVPSQNNHVTLEHHRNLVPMDQLDSL